MPDKVPEKYVLKGRVVTMAGGNDEIIDGGAIYIEGNTIAAVVDEADGGQAPPPAGFEGAPVVNTGDTIFPGLMDLHNHLSYNAIPLWQVEKRYENNGQWRSGASADPYRRNVSKPAQVLGRTEGLVEAVVRFVECRCLLGGVTTSQGMTLYKAGSIQKMYQGVVRNVEAPAEGAGLRAAGTKVANPPTKKEQVENYLRRLEKLEGGCYLQHLSEGRPDNKAARDWFFRLHLEGQKWAITPALCGIHSAALHPEDFEVMARHGGSMVWSPLSNLLLYGTTADIAAARAAGIRIGIGCDWGPSGSKNLLGEMKVAWLHNEEHDIGLSRRDIVAMATVDAAEILGWQDHLGTIEAGKYADLVLLNGKQGDPFRRLLQARESSLTMVIIDGVPRVFQRGFGDDFPHSEAYEIGDARRYLYLDHPETFPKVRNLSLATATARLKDALDRLPQIAAELDQRLAGHGLAAGAEPWEYLGGSRDEDGDLWRMCCELDEEGLDVNQLVATAREKPYVNYVTTMELEPITVVQDREHLGKLARALNLPAYIKNGLPPLYGEDPVAHVPDSVHVLHRRGDALPRRLLETSWDLHEFLGAPGALGKADRLTILDQAILILEQTYVHLPLKRAMHAVDPVQQLKLMRHRMEQTPEEELDGELEFHRAVTRVFSSLRDLHTVYTLPQPYSGKVAFLPFVVEEYWDDEAGVWRFIVSKVIGEQQPASFERGVELLHWNGVPIERAVVLNADRHAGSNPAARRARGLNALTLRPLATNLPPEEEWVTIQFRPKGGGTENYHQRWLVFDPRRGVRSVDLEGSDRRVVRGAQPPAMANAAAMGLDTGTDAIQEAKRVIFGGAGVEVEEAAVLVNAEQLVAASGAPGEVETFWPSVFRARKVSRDGRDYGYIRIFTFNVDSDEAFVEEFRRLAAQLPQQGLIIDVRGNGGGLIYAAEALLQLLTPHEIEPERAQFINSAVSLELCKANDGASGYPGLDLSPWEPSIGRAVETGATYSQGHPITPRERCNAIGQTYYGPVLLIIDALCYSATDIFAAGFQDHAIGKILGVSDATGAGGANVWTHSLLRQLWHPDASAPSPFRQLPASANIRVAVRRTVRVGDKQAGTIVEDLGIKPDFDRYRMSRRDLLEGNVDLLAEAMKRLAGETCYAFHPEPPLEDTVPREVTINTAHIDRVDVLVDDRPVMTFDVGARPVSIPLGELTNDSGDVVRIELRGYEKGERQAQLKTLLSRPWEG